MGMGTAVKKIIVGILVFFGIVFLLLILWPEDEEEISDGDEAGTVQTAQTDEPGEAGEPERDDAKNEVEPVYVGTDAKNATIMIYMNGSDLETQVGEATNDIREMLGSGIGENVNVIIQTMGTREWQDYDISSETSQIYRVNRGKLELLEPDLGQLDCTSPGTLSDFIAYGKKHYPADRYVFLFWDHGGGPVYGFGYDEWQDEEDALTLDEMRSAFSDHPDIRFDIIGMDCCIMANMETCQVLSPFCKFAVLSEDFESGLGWYYTDWMRDFEADPGMPTPLLGKRIIDGVIDANERDEENGQSTTMILVNERAVPGLVDKWIEYAYRNSDRLLGVNYSKQHMARGKGFIADFLNAWLFDGSDVTMSDYYVSDILSIVESIGREDELTGELRSALKACVAYFGHTSDVNELTGMAVSLPYGDHDFYEQLRKVYLKCGFDRDYIDWLEKFVDAEGIGDYNDYTEFENSWAGWSAYDEGWSGCTVNGIESDYGDDSCDEGYDYSYEDWTYDYEEEVWYKYEDDVLYIYDDETDLTCYYDEEEDEVYYYDEDEDDWFPLDE